MKKNYIKPEVAVMEIETESLMAGSITGGGDPSAQMNSYERDAQDAAMSKGHKFSIWD